MSKTWFTSDMHLGHANIIKYCNRPFASAQIMDEALISNWNSVVKQEDVVYNIGDFTFARDAEKYLSRLNGLKYLIKGNHDKNPSVRQGWANVFDYKEVRVNKQFIVLSHYAMRVWNRSHHNSWMLYGHSHGTLPDDPNALSIDVGVDCHDYTPISMEELERIMRRKTRKPIDHHK